MEDISKWLRLLDDETTKAKPPKVFALGEVARYGRRSIKGEAGLAGVKSLADQNAETTESCAEFGLPTCPEDYYAEPPGYSGKLMYDGGRGRHAIHEDLKFDEKGRRKVRPELTRLVADIEAGRKRAVVVWSLCRLIRSVRLCEHLLDLFQEHDVEIFTKDGRVDYRSPSGRESVIEKAAKYEAQRKEAKEGVERGLRRNRIQKKISSNPNALGIRTAGTRTNRVHFIDEELAWVGKMMRWYVGDNEPRPLSVPEISQRLFDEGFRWPEDLRKERENWSPRYPDRVHGWMVLKVLRNLRYIGFHPTAKGAYQCDAFLRNGEPLVPLELFRRVQERLERNSRVGNAANAARAFAALLLCAHDAQALQCQNAHVTLKGGEREKYPVWRAVPRDAGWCHHNLPNIRDEVLLEYVAEHLAPWVEAELVAWDERADGEAAQAVERLRVAEAKLKLDVERAEALALDEWSSDPSFAFKAVQEAKRRLRAVQAELYQAERRAESKERHSERARDLASEDVARQAEAIRAVVRWVAVVPSNLEPEVSPLTGEPARNLDQGRLLFCLVHGSYHTAVIHFGVHPKGYRKRTNLLRPAEPEECLEGVGDLPDPRGFVQRLEESWRRRCGIFDLGRDAPGYVQWLEKQVRRVTSEE